MAITVNLRYTRKKGAAQAFAREMISSGTIEKIRSEKGNLRMNTTFLLAKPRTRCHRSHCSQRLKRNAWNNRNR